jgi:hypothetical protein
MSSFSTPRRRAPTLSPACPVEGLVEHLDAGDDGGLGSRAEADDLDGVADLDDAALDTAGGDGAAALDREDVFDGHEEGLVDLAGGLGDVGVDGIEELIDGLADLVVLGVLEGGLGLPADDGVVSPGKPYFLSSSRTSSSTRSRSSGSSTRSTLLRKTTM